MEIRGRSRISRWGAWTRFEGAWTSDIGCFSVKMYVKMKELGPIGGRAPENLYVDPPMEMLSLMHRNLNVPSHVIHDIIKCM